MGRSLRYANQALRIRLARSGCTNRPFYLIVVTKAHKARDAKPLDQIGVYDPLPNDHNEKLVGINFEKLHYWFNRGAQPTRPISTMLGLAGFFPLHPMTGIVAARNIKDLQRIRNQYIDKSGNAVEGKESAV